MWAPTEHFYNETMRYIINIIKVIKQNCTAFGL